MKINSYLIIPVVVSGTPIVPIYLNDGLRANVRIRTCNSSNFRVRPSIEQREEIVYTGSMELSLAYSVSEMNTIGDRPHDCQISFIGPSGEDIAIAQERVYSASRGSPRLGVGRYASIYTQFPHGYMLFPGRLRAEFDEDTKFSMILNLQNPDGLCAPGSLFYTRRSVNSIYVDTAIVRSSETTSPLTQLNEPFNSYGYAISPHSQVDYIPMNVAMGVLQLIRPGLSVVGLGQILEDCNLDGGNYPSIHFRILERQSEHFVHKGTIVYGPSDYLEPTTEGRCRFKIRGSYPYQFGLNFLNTVATYFKPDHIGFCDPALPPTGR
jgi:hypothetical protein